MYVDSSSLYPYPVIENFHNFFQVVKKCVFVVVVAFINKSA